MQKLQEKLDDHVATSSGGGEGGHEAPDQHTQLFGVPSLHDQNEGDHGPHLPNLNSTSHLANSHDGHNELADTGKSLNTDTIVLVGSLIVMIFIGNITFLGETFKYLHEPSIIGVLKDASSYGRLT